MCGFKKQNTTVKKLASYVSHVGEVTNSCKAWCRLKVGSILKCLSSVCVYSERA